MAVDPVEIDAARAYQSLFVPSLFGRWAPTVADAARIAAGDRVLDVACGTGALAVEALGRVGETGSVTGVDAGAGMLAVAREIAPRVEYREATAESLPFDDEQFDVVVSQFGLMFFIDQVAALREMARVLRPGGRLAVAVWASLDDNQAYADAVELLDSRAGPAAADALRAPFVLGRRSELVDMCRAAGLSDARVDTVRRTASFPSVRVMVEADLRGWLPMKGVMLDEPTIAGVLDAADAELAAYVDDAGRATFETAAHIITVAGR